jgi:DNA-directed RNA polymerase specialized sigma24 family protein
MLDVAGGEMSSRADADAELESLVVEAADGDERAWGELWQRLEPRLLGLVRRPTFIANLADRGDAARDVVVAIMGRLRDQRFHRLGLYVAARHADPELTFMRWLTVLAKRVAIDCLRADPDYLDRRRSRQPDEPPGVWIQTEPLPVDSNLSGGRPPMTNRVTARQILRYAAGVLSDEQRRALEMWASGASTDEIAVALGVDGANAAERMVRAAVERLRRRFREGPAT